MKYINFKIKYPDSRLTQTQSGKQITTCWVDNLLYVEYIDRQKGAVLDLKEGRCFRDFSFVSNIIVRLRRRIK